MFFPLFDQIYFPSHEFLLFPAPLLLGTKYNKLKGRKSGLEFCEHKGERKWGYIRNAWADSSVHNSPRKKQDSQNLSISSSDINFMNIPFNRKFGFFFLPVRPPANSYQLNVNMLLILFYFYFEPLAIFYNFVSTSVKPLSGCKLSGINWAISI